VSRYQKGKTNLDFTEARDSEWQWHQLGHMQVCISLQQDNHTSTPLLSFLQAGCPSCRPTNSVKALKALYIILYRSVKLKHSFQHMYHFVGLRCFSGQFPISATFHHAVTVAGHFRTSAEVPRPKDRSVQAYGLNYLSTRTEMSWCRSVRTLLHQCRTVLRHLHQWQTISGPN